MKRLILAITILLYATPALAHEGWGGHGGGGWGHGWGGSAFGNALGGSIAGSIIGNAIGNMFQPAPVIVAPPPVYIQPAVPELQPFTPPWYGYCAQKFRTFNPSTGYYVGYDGQPHLCS